MFKQLSEQDASYLYLETPETPQHVGGVSLVELPPDYQGDFFEDYKRHIASRIHLIPMLHQKLVQLPFDIDHPFWTDDDQVDVDYHIRHQTVPRPGRISQLEELVGRLHSNFLDRSRPLWEFYVIDGLESGQVAIYTKIHHAAMDGAASQNLIAMMYDPTPQPRSFPPPERKPGNQEKIDIPEVLRGMAGHFLRQEVRALQYLPEVLKAWAKVVLPDAETLQYGKPVLPPLRTPQTLFNVGITSQRTYAMRTLPLSRFKRVAKATDAKLNDVELAVCAGALRRYLQDHDALPKPPLTAMVPVSLNTPGEPAQANQNAAVLCSLATDVADPLKRLALIREGMLDQKRLLSNIKNALLPDLSFVGSGALVRGMVDLYRRAKLADRLPPLANLVVSNVAGPPVPLYIAGARLLSFYPCSIPFHSTALNITVESYCDSLDFGLIGCRRTVPDLAELADHLGEELGALEQALAARDTPAPARAVAPALSGEAVARPAAQRATTKRATTKRATTKRAAAKTAATSAPKPAGKAPAKRAAAPAARRPAKPTTEPTTKPAAPRAAARKAAATPSPAMPSTAMPSPATPSPATTRTRRARRPASVPNGDTKSTS